MKTFLVFEPADSGRDAAAADGVRFVREKFYWLALFFAPLWLLWHRLWLGFLCWLVAEMLIGIAAFMFDLDPRAAAIAALLPSLVVAFEGSELRRRKLLRGCYREAAVVVGGDREDAERHFFAEWVGSPPGRQETRKDARPPAPPAPPAPAPRSAQPAPSNPVIGLFPEPGAGR